MQPVYMATLEQREGRVKGWVRSVGKGVGERRWRGVFDLLPWEPFESFASRIISPEANTPACSGLI